MLQPCYSSYQERESSLITNKPILYGALHSQRPLPIESETFFRDGQFYYEHLMTLELTSSNDYKA